MPCAPWFVRTIPGPAGAPYLLRSLHRAPAGAPLPYHRAFSSAYDVEAAGTTDQIYTVRADGTHLLQRTFGGAEKRNPAWLKR